MVGASFDTPAANKAFADAERLGFPLLCDVNRVAGLAYEVVRAPDDQYAAYPLRVSYLVDPAGTVRRAYAVTDVEGHADAVLADLAALQA